MTIRYTCDGCGSSLKIEDRLAGTEGRCPKCGAAFQVPQPSASKLVAAGHRETASPAEPGAPADPGAGGSWETDEDLAAALLMDGEDQRPGGDAKPDNIRYTCSGCGSHLTIRPDRAGSEGRCPKCSARFVVPGQAPANDTAPEVEAGSSTDAGAPPESAPATPRRRSAPETADTRFATATAASALLKQHAHADSQAHVETEWTDEPSPRKAEAKDREGFDWAGLSKELGRVVVPGLAALVVACLGVYWLASMVMVGSPSRPSLGQVTGTVTLDGQPLAGALVTFRPEEPKVDGKSVAESVGRTDPSGRYTLMYVQNVSGAAIGEHRVHINATDARGAEILPPIYHLRSTHSVNVQAGSNRFDFELQSNP